MYHLVTGLYSSYTQKPRYNVLLLGISGSGKTAWLDKVRSKVTKTGSRSLARFQPTVGQNVLDIKLSRATLHFWDLGGEASLRRLWNRYFEEADVFVWAINAYDWISLITIGEGEEDAQEDDDDDDTESKGVKMARAEESWKALSALRSHSHLTSIPLLILCTHMDQLDVKQAAHFEEQIKTILQERLTELRRVEDLELNDEMNRFDQSKQADDYGRHIWSEWQVITCSAKDGSGSDNFINWLHSHAKTSQDR
ncbi:hypothetical protein CBS101457_003906 [Exobasidium rhododendri]|nr:hypothetical protein CBS101457_003906 [Exobasidium rhododendri]